MLTNLAVLNKSCLALRKMPIAAKCARSRARARRRMPMRTQVPQVRLALPIKPREAQHGNAPIVVKLVISRPTKGIIINVSFDIPPFLHPPKHWTVSSFPVAKDLPSLVGIHCLNYLEDSCTKTGTRQHYQVAVSRPFQSCHNTAKADHMPLNIVYFGARL